MTTELTLSPASLLPSSSPHGEAEFPSVESTSDWNQPLHDPHRSALLASAFQKLADSAQRLERLHDRLAELAAQTAKPSLS